MNDPDAKVAWWPPPVGTKLRKLEYFSAGGNRVKLVAALFTVVSVFEHHGETKIVTAVYLPARKHYRYDIFDEFHVSAYKGYVSEIWRDEDPIPAVHAERLARDARDATS